MPPKIAINVNAVDKTSKGLAEAARSVGRFADKTNRFAKRGGLATIDRQMTNIRSHASSFGMLSKSLGRFVGEMGGVTGGFADAKMAASGFNRIGLGALAGIEGSALTAGVALTNLGAIATVTAAATYAVGVKSGNAAADIARTAKTIGIAGRDLEAAQKVNERFGVSTAATTSSLASFAATLFAAKTGANNFAAGALTQLGIRMKKTKDDTDDVADALDQVADKIAAQKDPQKQRAIAQAFGVEAMLPALRQGSARLKAERAQFKRSGAGFTDDELTRGERLQPKATNLQQDFSAVWRRIGSAAMHPAEAMADAGLTATKAMQDGARQARTLMTRRSGFARLGESAVTQIEDFASRIEHQESRGHQFDRHGRPLTSRAGAVGVMQMLPETAKRAARRMGVAWDQTRFETDATYNRMLGRAELSRLKNKYGGDEVLAAAAYNAGEGRLDGYSDKKGHHPGWLERFGDPRKGEISDAAFAKKIPFAETRDYVANTANARVEIVLRNAPPGTVAKVSGDQGLQVDMHVARSVDGVG